MEKMKKVLFALRPLLNLWPALLVAVALSLCSGALTPQLAAIPELLEQPAAAAETEDAADDGDTSASPEEDAEAVQLAAGVGTYTDGTFTGSARGYGGTVTVQVTVENSQITAVEILSASGETSSFLNKAKGVIDSVLQAQTWEVDVVSGATYSSRGILGAIQNALTDEEVDNPEPTTTSAKKQSSVSFTDPDSYKDGTYYGSAQGFGGKIKVKVVISGGKISSVSVVSASGETSSYLKKAKGVLKRIVKANSPNVDTVSGATYSSRGILNATKNALKSASGKSEKKEEVTTLAKPAAEWKDGTYTGTAEGFGGDITVRVTVSGGRITKITVVSAEDETPAYLKRAKTILDTIVEKQTTDVDVISGATYSSTGLKNATANALKQAEVSSGSKEEEKSETEDKKENNTGSHSRYKDGTYQATVECTDNGADGDFCYDLTVSVTIKDDEITAIDVTHGSDKNYPDNDEDNDYFCDRAANPEKSKSVVSKILAAQSVDVDVTSGATYSSNAIKKAVAEALEQAENAAEDEDDDQTDEEDKKDDEQKDDENKDEEDDKQDEEDKKDDADSDEDKKDENGGDSSDEETESIYNDGTYTATVLCSDGDEEYGFCYDLTATVTIEGGKISQIDVTRGSDQYYEGNDEDNEYYCGKAQKGVVSDIISTQSTDVDIVSGATYSSKAIKKAVAEALEQAKK